MNIDFERIRRALRTGPDAAAAALDAELTRVYALPADVHARLGDLTGLGAVHSETDAAEVHASYVLMATLRGHLNAPEVPDVTPAPLAALEPLPGSERVTQACAQLARAFPGRDRAWHAAAGQYFTVLWDGRGGPLTELAQAYRALAGKPDGICWAALHA